MATNQTQIKNNVYKAIDVIAKERIDSLKLDKTIVGTIEAKVSNKDNQYRINYNGGTFYAYAQDNSVYLPNITVYVLIPENDFTKKKWIIGRVSNTRVDQNIDVVASAMNQYSVIGNNVITVKDNAAFADVFKLHSYEVKKANATFQSANVLYDSKQPQISILDINAADLLTYVKKSQALSLAADFRTNLSKEQQKNVSGNYGLIFNLRFQNKNSSYATMQDKWNTLEPNTITAAEDAEYQATTDRLNNYEVRVRSALNEDTTVQIIQSNINIIYSDISSFIAEIGLSLDNETKSLVEQYLQLLSDLMALTVDQDGNAITREQLIAEYNNWFAGDSDSYVETIESYYLDVDSMVGNPYNLSNYAHQYITIPIDPERFIGIDTIYFFCDGFIQDNAKAEMWGYDLFVKNVEINCLEELDDADDDHRLILEYPQGTIFRTNDSIDTRIVRAKLLYQNREDLTSFSSFSWFKKDSSVTSEDPRYTALAGAGWLKISTDSTITERTFTASDNKSYENYYKVIATYNMETILVKEFILYNEANHHDIKIISDNGFAFELADEKKTLTCTIDGEDVSDGYVFSWYMDGELLDKTAQWYEDEIALITELDRESLQLRSFYTNKYNQLKDISWEINKLIFPSSKVPSNSEVVISCMVKQNTYDIGQDEIKLSQGEVRTLKGYHIVIENGSQTFQYNEAGVSPASERYNDPITILPLSCKFYSPGGGLINKLSYTVKWQVPTENTLIVVDKSKLLEGGIDPNGICNFTISDDYNYASVNNQITCIVEFNGDVYTETTDFFFGKIGENGTNGTDVVAKIVPIEEKTNSILNNELLMLHIYSDNTIRWNTGAAINTPVLELQLYRRNEYITPDQYQRAAWTISGGTEPLHMSAYASSTGAHGEIGTIDYSIAELPQTSNKEYLTNQIVQGQASLRLENSNYQSYYYSYPIPTCIWNVASYSLGIDKTYTLRQILYNADGRNPVYNKNQGVKLNLPEGKKVIWSTIGGVNNDSTTSALEIKETEDNNFVYVIPVDVYNGEYTNNCIKAEICSYTPAEIEIDEEGHETIISEEVISNPEATILIPIHMSLNTYGLASLNAWDGNSVTIDEDKGYVLAPQIGAGKKHDEDNTFTGVVMGIEQTYEDALQKKENIGLLGYSHGRQSIFLNADDGSATFGLPELESTKNDPRTEGRIRLIPGGESNIGNWVIGQNFLYNGHYEDENRTLVKELNNGYKDGWVDEQGSPHTEDIGHTFDLPQEANGVLLAADPSYISVKSRAITDKDLENATDNIVIEPGDFLEAQIDPNQFSVFSIMRHHLYKQNENDKGTWIRSKIAYVDAAGRFVSGAMHHGDSSLGVGYVGGLGYAAGDEKYIGLNLETTNKKGDIFYPIFKAFISSTLDDESTLYISGGATNVNKPDRIPGENTGDYRRPIQIMGKQLDLKTSQNSTNSRLSMGPTSIFLGQENAKLSLNNTTATITTSNTFTETIGAKNVNNKGDYNQKITGIMNIKFGYNFNDNTYRSEIKEDNDGIKILKSGYYDFYLKGSGQTGESYLSTDKSRIRLQTNISLGSGIASTDSVANLSDKDKTMNSGGSIDISALNTNYGISLYTTGVGAAGTEAYNSGLRLLPRKGAAGFFHLYADGAGHIKTTTDFYKDNTNYSAVEITEQIGTHAIYLDGEFTGQSGYSLYAAKALNTTNITLRGMASGRQNLNNTLTAVINKLNELIRAYNGHTHYISESRSGTTSTSIGEFGSANDNIFASSTIYTVGATGIAGKASPTYTGSYGASGSPSGLNGEINPSSFQLSGDWDVGWTDSGRSISKGWSTTLSGDTGGPSSTVNEV